MPVAMRRRWTKGLLKYLWRNKRPDLDKLVRAVFDGVVESGLIKDDAQFVHLVTLARCIAPRRAARGFASALYRRWRCGPTRHPRRRLPYVWHTP